MALNLPEIKEKDYPNLFQAADCASKEAQSFYINIMRIDLIMMLIAAAISVYNYELRESKIIIYCISGFFLLVSLILTIVLLSKKFEDKWYQGRALAESCKTLTWRFMTCSELFEHNLTDAQARTALVKKLDELRKGFSEISKDLDASKTNLLPVTPLMLRVRNETTLDRKEYYVKYRIEDQKEWYAKKAKENKDMYNVWFFLILSTQAIAFGSVMYLLVNPESKFNWTGLFTTIASAAISWLQLKRHQELKQAYTTTSQELNKILNLSHNISSEDDLNTFVLDSENAVSREHTSWLAQRRL